MAEQAVEEEAKSHVAQLFGRDTLYLVIWAVQLLGAALSTPILTRVLGADQFGTVTSANAVMQIIFIVAGFGLQAAVQREHSGHGNLLGARRLIGFGLIAAVALTFTAWSTVDLWSGPLGLDDNLFIVRLSVIWAGMSAVTNTSLGILRSQDRLFAFSMVGLLQSVIAEVVALVLCKVIAPTAENFLWGQTIAQAVAMLLALALVPPAFIWLRHADFIGRSLLFALPLIPSTLATFVLSSSDRLVVEASLGSEEVARYQVAYNVAGMPMLLLSVLSSAWMPRFFSLDEGDERSTVLRESRDALSRLMVPVILGFAFGGPIVLRIWAPSSYRPDDLQFVVSIVLITVLPFMAHLAVTRTLMTYGRTGAIAIANALAALVNLGLNLVLIPRYGLEGSAVSTLVAYILLWLVLAWLGRDVSPGRAPFLLHVQLVGACLVALAAALVPESGPVIVVRLVLGTATVAWFALVFLRISRTPAPETLDEHVQAPMPMMSETMTFSARVPVRVPAIGRATVRRMPVSAEQTARIYYGGRYS
jgi:O-antigen/teichoic acid export membrane protein